MTCSIRQFNLSLESDQRRMNDWISIPWILISIWGATVTTVALIVSVLVLVHKVSKWAGEVNSDRNKFKGFMKEIRDDMKEIREKINDIFQKRPPEFFKTSSPLQLSDRGKFVSKKIRAKAVAQMLSLQLKDRVKDKNLIRFKKFVPIM